MIGQALGAQGIPREGNNEERRGSAFGRRALGSPRAKGRGSGSQGGRGTSWNKLAFHSHWSGMLFLEVLLLTPPE